MRTPIPFGRFLLLDRVAVGGMAEVFVAVRRDDPAGRLLALKRILPTLAEDAEFITMFLDEARLVVQLDHPGIPPLHELGKQGDGYYIAMEYSAGKDLRALLDRCRARKEPLPVALAAHVAARVADALDHAHRKRDADGRELRVVHRDVSPANVLLGFDGSVRIIDFGIAQAALRTRRQDTVLRGKFGYMSPEMVRGLPVDRRSDVFALGVVLHEMLTGERLFRAGSELAVLEKVRSAEVAPPSASRAGLPRGLDAVVLRALAREPEDRYAWASELRDALLPFARAGRPPGDPPALARLMARTFPAELRAELDRAERARVAPPPSAEVEPVHEPTQLIDLRALAPAPAPHAEPLVPPAAPPPPAREAPRPAPPPRSAPAAAPRAPPAFRPPAPTTPTRGQRWATLAALLAGVAVVVASLVLAAALRQPARARPTPRPEVAAAAPRPPPPPAPEPRPHRRSGRLLVQARAAATLILDGTAAPSALGAGEVRAVELAPGEHRIELRTEDGRRAGATVQILPGQTAELLGVELQ